MCTHAVYTIATTNYACNMAGCFDLARHLRPRIRTLAALLKSSTGHYSLRPDHPHDRNHTFSCLLETYFRPKLRNRDLQLRLVMTASHPRTHDQYTQAKIAFAQVPTQLSQRQTLQTAYHSVKILFPDRGGGRECLGTRLIVNVGFQTSKCPCILLSIAAPCTL